MAETAKTHTVPPAPPDGLAGIARQEWVALAPRFDELHVKEAHFSLVVSYCISYELLWAAYLETQESGMFVWVAEGRREATQSASTMVNALNSLGRMAGLLGLDPLPGCEISSSITLTEE